MKGSCPAHDRYSVCASLYKKVYWLLAEAPEPGCSSSNPESATRGLYDFVHFI
jgi:hypothetical protein